MANIGRINVELAVFLMIALIAFGGFASLSVSDDSGNDLTGDWKKPKIIKKIQKAAAAPFKKIEAEAKRVETRVSKEISRAMIKGVSYPMRHPGSFAKNAKDLKTMVQTTGVIMAVVSGLPMLNQDAPPDTKTVQTYNKNNPPQGWKGAWPANNPTIKIDESTVALWGKDGHGGATSARDLLINPDSYASNIVQNDQGELAYKYPNDRVDPKQRWFPPGMKTEPSSQGGASVA